ncbi:TolC family protein [Gaoshiqia sp. Z1-71]|uniref:TolC family protein n=1 Tax=Gaoshiqia hydrogeniformans TaxID=3290090 RepID=UPI003BF817A2
MKTKMKQYLLLLLLAVPGAMPVSAQTLTLDSCKVYAIENNKRLKEARMKINESEEIKKNAFTNFFPKVNAQAITFQANDYLIDINTPEMNLPVYDGNPANLSSATQYAYVPGLELKALDYMNVGMLTATQPVYAGGRIRSGYKLATLGKEVSEETLNLSTRDVVVKTEEYYWSLVSLQAKRKTLESYKTLLNSLLKDVRVSFDAGLAQKSDLLKIQLKINETNANQLKLENGISLVKMALCQHIGLEYSENISLQDTAFSVVVPEMLYLSPATALTNRSEYQLLNKAIDAEILQKRLARGEFLPQLAVGMQGQYLDFADKSSTYGIAFASLSIPISDWWGGSHKLREHEIKIDVARNKLNEKSELMELQMEKAYKELTESYQQISVAQSLAEQAREHLQVITDNYEAGILSTSDLLEAQAIFQESQDGLIDAKSAYQIRQVYYKQAIAQTVY